MDLFRYLDDYQAWVCVACGYAPKPQHYSGHLHPRHADHPMLGTMKKVNAVVEELMRKPLINPDKTRFRAPPAGSPALPHLPIYDGVACVKCGFVSSSSEHMRTHYRKKHAECKRPKGRPPKALGGVAPRWEEVSCQRLFVLGTGSHFFAVISPAEIQEEKEARQRREMALTLSEAEFMRAQIDEALEEGSRETAALESVILDNATQTEVSPWLEMTRWPKYLHGHSFSEVALLAAPADPTSEPLLVEFSESLGRIIEEAQDSIRNDKVNVFDQARINSFIQKRRAWDRPLLTKLQKSTYREYKQVFQRLIFFAFRTVQPEQKINLSHRLTTSQLRHLDQMMGYGEELLALKDGRQQNGTQKDIQSQLDRACLLFCIAVLDHTLKGDLFESVAVGFLAVLGVDPAKKIFRDASSFTSYLSAFVKISQMLVIQRSVMMAEDGEVDHPSDVLDEMRERFMIHGSRSPFNWVLRLRAYGKKIRNTTTSLGYIYWSDDYEKLTYKQLEMTMTNFKDFARIQVELAQSELEQLFLLHEEEKREDVIPTFELRDLKDNPTENAKGWSFLKDPRNKDILPDGKRWMLDRVLESDWLRAEFLEVRKRDSKVTWKLVAAKRYIAKINCFLERLLLVIHLAAGQPARGTELLSLRHCNTVNGHHRSIFLEGGLVSTVTAYHKGYNIVGSTKIIHRYLPKEVSELVVYYLWFILPFWRKLEYLVWDVKGLGSPYLWPKGDGSWESTRLTTVLKEEAEEHLKTFLNITFYRHAAIAISRVHLKCGGFKRDYEAEDNTTNKQASHTSWIAGTIYARGLEEAPGAVEARRAQYRAISREWHNFLGFQTYLPSRKRPLSEMLDMNAQASKNVKKQRRCYI